jgi:uncharacterized protein YraI
MTKSTSRFLLCLLVSLFGLALLAFSAAPLPAYAQQPTVAIATVTGTPTGAYIIVNADQDQVNVRTGPGTDYPAVGVLVAGEQAGARGISTAGLWIQIAYPSVEGGLAWVYAPLVTLFEQGNPLRIVEPPPTPTPRVTPTIDPTLAAQFVLEIPATRLPTFTSAPPLELVEFEEPGAPGAAGIPMGMIITGIGLLGMLGAAVSYLRER